MNSPANKVRLAGRRFNNRYKRVNLVHMRGTEMNLTCTLRKTMCSVTFFSVLTFVITGCTIIQIQQETDFAKEPAALGGKVSATPFFQDRPVEVAVNSKKGRKRSILHYTTPHEPGPYELIAPAGTLDMAAFDDKNNNLTYDRGEPA